jgi:hypothetical protein
MSRRPILLLLAVVAGLLSVLLAIAVNIATGGQLPGPHSPYREFAWPAVAVLAVATVGLAIWQFALDLHPGSHASLLAGGGTGGTTLVAQVPISLIPAELPPDIATFTGRQAELARLRGLLAPPQAPARAWPPGRRHPHRPRRPDRSLPFGAGRQAGTGGARQRRQRSAGPAAPARQPNLRGAAHQPAGAGRTRRRDPDHPGGPRRGRGGGAARRARRSRPRRCRASGGGDRRPPLWPAAPGRPDRRGAAAEPPGLDGRHPGRPARRRAPAAAAVAPGRPGHQDELHAQLRRP